MSPTANRNDPCPCGSGMKYKKCCGKPKLPRKLQAKVIKSTGESLFSVLKRGAIPTSKKETPASLGE